MMPRPEAFPRMSATAPDPLRVLFVIPGQAEGSSMIFARRQAQSLREEGARVSIFHLGSRTSFPGLLGEYLRFRREARRLRPQVVHAHFGTVTALFSVLAAGKVPVVVTYRGSDLNRVPTSDGLRSRAGRWFSQIAALKSARIICVSRALRDRLWWRRSRVTILASGVDTQLFRPGDRKQARAVLGWQRSARVILFNSGHDPRNKRLDLARAAVAAARRMLAGVEFKVLDGSIDPAMVPTLMRAADCLLVTSDAEGSPTVVQEAIATNLPIVSVDAGDIAERVEGVRGTRIVSRDPLALGSALVEVLRNPERSDGSLRAEEFSLRSIAGALMKVYACAVAPRESAAAREP